MQCLHTYHVPPGTTEVPLFSRRRFCVLPWIYLNRLPHLPPTERRAAGELRTAPGFLRDLLHWLPSPIFFICVAVRHFCKEGEQQPGSHNKRPTVTEPASDMVETGPQEKAWLQYSAPAEYSHYIQSNWQQVSVFLALSCEQGSGLNNQLHSRWLSLLKVCKLQ